MTRGPRRRPRMGRVTVVVPSFFTLASLFFGIWSIVLAAQGDFYRASWWIVIAGACDMMDGLSARMGNLGSRFGAELDSLADLVSFGVAPSLLLYFLQFARLGPFAWLFLYGFVVCAALRLARFNVQTGEEPKQRFTGLPTPAAGMTLATYYPFTQTSIYETLFANWPWNTILIFLVITLSVAMVSNVQYARMPRIGFRSAKGIAGLAVHLTIVGFLIWSRDVFFFPLGITYMAYGIVRSAVLGIVERGDEGEDGERRAASIPFVLRTKERTQRRQSGE